MKHINIIITFLCAPLLSLSAQTVDLQFAATETKMIGPSPQAAAMTRYADTPVSYGLGLAQVSIPLYEVHSRSLSLPVSLSYNSAGVRVDEVSGTVGLNWTLNAGGVISRTVAGRVDGDLGGWDDLEPVYSNDPISEIPYTWNSFDKIASGEIDSERDLYSFSFCGNTGSFYLVKNTSGQYVAKPTTATDLDIKYLAGVFVITDTYGTKYVFTETETTSSFTSMTLPILGAGSGSAEYYPQQVTPVTAWYLTEIVSMDGTDIIRLYYEQPPFFLTESHSYVRSYSFTYKYLSSGQYSWQDQYGQWAGSAPAVSGQLGAYQTTRSWTPRLVKCIKWDGGSVRFNYTAPPSGTNTGSNVRRAYTKVLQQMNVWSVPVGGQDSTLVRQASFSLDATNDKRTLLRNIAVTGQNSAAIESYAFTYISESTNMGAYAKDLFGYYNGQNYNDYLAFLRLFEDNYTFPSETVADRSYNATALHALSLETITTGSGSVTEFTYEGNSLPVSGSGVLFSTIGIGQRMAKISTYDLTPGSRTLVRERSFTYYDPQLTIPASYFTRRAFATVSESFREDLLSGHGWWCGTSYPMPRTCYVTFADQSVLPGVPLERAQIFYGEVDELVTGPSSAISGRTEYYYDVSGAALSTTNGQWSLNYTHDSHDDALNTYGSHVYHFFERPPYQIPRTNGLGPSVYFEPVRFHFIPEDRPQMREPSDVKTYRRLASGANVPVSWTHNSYDPVTEDLRIGWRVRSMIAKGDEMCVKDTLCGVDFYREEIVHRRVWYRRTGTTVTEYLDDGQSTGTVATSYFYDRGTRTSFTGGITYPVASSSTPPFPASGSILSPRLTLQIIDGTAGRTYARYSVFPDELVAAGASTYGWAQSLLSKGYRQPVGEEVIAGGGMLYDGKIILIPGATSFSPTSVAGRYVTWASCTPADGGSAFLKPVRIEVYRKEPGTTAGLSDAGPTVEYTQYDHYGNPLEVQQDGQPVRTYVWSYGGLRPVAEIVGVDRSTMRSALTASQRSTLDAIASSPALTAQQLTFLRTTLRPAMTAAMVSVYTYDGPGRAMSSAEDPSGRSTSYSYDGAGRLASVKDDNGHLVEGYLYELTRGSQNLPNRILSLSYTASGATSLPASIASALSASSSTLPAMKDVAYLDGLGRSVQGVSVGAAGSSGQDLVTPAAPDFLDHEDARTYLPYPAATNSSTPAGSFRSGALAAQETYYGTLYGSSPKAYAETVYELSSRDRVTATSLPGFPDRTTLSTAGSPADSLPVLAFNADNRTLSASGSYAANCFTVNSTAGADGSLTESWLDDFGTPVLERVLTVQASGSTPEHWAETRYVKDVRGRVVCVIPPAEYAALKAEIAQNNGTVSSFATTHCYTYTYDSRDRVVTRRLPDRVVETLSYNQADFVTEVSRIAAGGSGTEKFITEYDIFLRPKKEKYRYGSGSAITLAEYVYDAYPSTMVSGNASLALPKFSAVSGIATAADRDSVRMRGLKTAERVRIIDPGESPSTMVADGNTGAKYVIRAFYYDRKGNVIQTAESRTDVGATARLSTKYGFAGNILKSRETVGLPAAGGGAATTTHLNKTFSYDTRLRPTGRSAQLTHGGTTGSQGTLTSAYDNLGQLSTLTRTVGSSSDVTTYAYTIQGWLSDASGGTYSETLRYANPTHGTSALPGKAGLVTEWVTTQSGATASTYAYTYDGAGRLTGSTRYSGTSTTALSTLTERDISYDDSGNLLTLKRYGSGSTPADNFSFTYTGTTRTGSTYDSHGNMTSDAVNGTTLAWNILGLPKSIADGSDTARRVYAADGTLLAVLGGASGTAGRIRIGSMDITRASSGALTLESAAWEGGRIRPGTGSSKILFQITDHLGSVRAVRAGSGTVIQRFDYYPFGSVISGTSSGTPPQPALRWRFGGKEIAGQKVSASAPSGTPAAAAGSPYLDYGARLYDPRTSSWLSQDPLSEKYYSISPYAYCAGNPVNLVDPEGKGPIGWAIKYYATSRFLEYHTNNNTLRTIGYSMKHPFVAYKIGPGLESFNGISAIAGKFSTNIMRAAGYSENSEGTPINAFRHALWQAMISSEFGENTAIRIGNAHEDDINYDLTQRQFTNRDIADTVVDMLNNIIGRQIATDHPDLNSLGLAQEVLLYYHTEGLWVMEGNEQSIQIRLQTLSEDEYLKALLELSKLHLNGLEH